VPSDRSLDTGVASCPLSWECYKPECLW
jgi:hypothetical protein